MLDVHHLHLAPSHPTSTASLNKESHSLRDLRYFLQTRRENCPIQYPIVRHLLVVFLHSTTATHSQRQVHVRVVEGLVLFCVPRFQHIAVLPPTGFFEGFELTSQFCSSST